MKLVKLVCEVLRRVVAGHVSEECNRHVTGGETRFDFRYGL
jgi:hypothetical protein